jgi:hypothetical protein
VTALDHFIIQTMLETFPNAYERIKGSTQTEQFIFDTKSFQVINPAADIFEKGENEGWVDLSKLSPDTFSRRLALVFNTYYQITLAPHAYVGGLPSKNLSVYGPDTLPVSDVNAYLPTNLTTVNTTMSDWFRDFQTNMRAPGLLFVGATANATTTKSHEIYSCNFAWLALLFAAAGILLITGAASLILKRKTLGPEMIGFVASMTYENPHVKIPGGGSMLDAMERARLLKDVEVHVGDVSVNDSVGHIAFAAGVPVRRLERGRLYL